MKQLLQFRKNAQISIVFMIVLCCCACKKMLNVPLPPDVVLVSESYKDDATATIGVLSIYTRILAHNNFEFGGITLNSSLYTDDIKQTTSATNNFYTNNLTSAGTETNLMMSNAYETVLYVNTNIQQILASNTLSDGVKKELLGECYFLRAYAYFYIVNYWGDAAALVLSPDVPDTQSASSTPKNSIYMQIVSDLKMAQAGLTNSYPSGAADKSRPNVQAANALLARIYLYIGQYNDAITQANAVITSGLYTPLPAPSVNFLKTSTETIWSMQAQSLGGRVVPTPDVSRFIIINTGAAPAFAMTNTLLNTFENGDTRYSNWVKAYNITIKGVTTTYFEPYKYKQSAAGSIAAATENYVMLRAAEMYLIVAEAYYKNGDVPNAVTNLNVVRARAGLTGLATSITADQCRIAIEHENQIEFFCEHGHRFFDLKRWPGVAGGTWRSDEVLPVTKAGIPTFAWATYKNLFPLADKDIQADKNLVQNPGY